MSLLAVLLQHAVGVAVPAEPETIGQFQSDYGVVQMLFDSNTRKSRRVSHPGADFDGLMHTMQEFKKTLPNPGAVPTKLFGACLDPGWCNQFQ